MLWKLYIVIILVLPNVDTKVITIYYVRNPEK